MPLQNNKSIIKAWLAACRLRTLPLALSSILLGYFLAINEYKGDLNLFLLSALTTIFLQILSNLANDYGDALHGADAVNRVGPERMVQSGIISKQSMLLAIVLFSIFSFVSGIVLLIVSFDSISFNFILFLILGLLAIGAAIKYTAGKNPYGYAGLGDFSVLLFFGLVGVCGSYFLQTKSFNNSILLPALSSGLLATAVLNINNLRDIESDKQANKRSIPVRIGYKNGLIYHVFLITSAIIAAIIYLLVNEKITYKLMFIVPVVILLVFHTRNVLINGENPALMNKYLKQMALLSLTFSLSLGIVLLG